MNNFKSHFEMHKRFRNGIFLLVIVIISLIGILFFYSKNNQPPIIFEELKEYQAIIDSLKVNQITKKKAYKIKPFNPNFITDYKGYTLGMSIAEIDRLHDYRKNGKWINSIVEFKNVTKVSDSLLKSISPLFKFPDWVSQRNFNKKKTKGKIQQKTFDQKLDLNRVTTIQLQEKFNIPDFIADRIIKYRTKIDGFVDDIQLKDVIGLYNNQRIKILTHYTVKSGRKVIPINIHKATVKELTEVPYIDFEMALEIRDHIIAKGKISSFEELSEIDGFSLEKIDRIALYLSLE